MTSENPHFARPLTAPIQSDFVANGLSNNQHSGGSTTPALLVQQRQILAMMGLDIWVQRDCATTKVDYQTFAEQHKANSEAQLQSLQALMSETGVDQVTVEGAKEVGNVSSEAQLQSPVAVPTKAVVSPDQDQTTAALDNDKAQKSSAISENQTVNNDPIQALKQKFDASENKSTQLKVNLADSLEQVAPFEVIGAHFKDWVLLADVSVFRDENTLRLWENIISGLSISPQLLKFPICPEISDKESANASVAGFIFSLAKNHEIKVAALTPMPKGIEHPQLEKVPYLIEMLEDSGLKKQLWQVLNQAQII